MWRQPRRRLLAMLAMAASLPVAAGAFALGAWQVALLVVVALQAGAAILLVDVRGRIGSLAGGEREVSAELRRVSESLQGLERRIDNVGASMLSAIETDRLEGGDRIAELREATVQIRDATAQVRDQVAGAREELERQDRRLTSAALPRRARQAEALLRLYGRVKPRGPMPQAGGWALDATSILALLEVVEQRRPRLVLELGSGTSSVWLGYALERLGSGCLVSIDHQARYAEATAAQVRSHGLDGVIEVRLAPLVEAGLQDHATPWYDHSAFDDLDEIDLLIVDGPPKAAGRHSRYPALPKLAANLAGDARVVIDDVDRPDEMEVLERWCVEIPELGPVSALADSLFQITAREQISG